MHRTRVLIVEDDPDCAALLRNMLEQPLPASTTGEVEYESCCVKGEFDVIQVASMNVGAEVLHFNKFDAVLLDLILSDGEGETVANVIHEAANGAAVIAHSGVEDLELIRRLIYSGKVQDYIVKATFAEAITLRRKICDAIEEKKVTQEAEQHRIASAESEAERRRTNFAATMRLPHEYRSEAQWMTC